MSSYEVLTASQRQQLQGVVQNLSQEDVARYYTFSSKDLAVIKRHKKKTRFGFALQLCYLRFPGRPVLEEEVITDQVLLYIGQQLKLPTQLVRQYGQGREQTLDDHLRTLQKEFGFRRFDDEAEQGLSEWLHSVALDLDDGSILLTLLMDEMRKRQIIQPKLARLENLVGKAHKNARQTLFSALTGQLSAQQLAQLIGLLDLRTEVPYVSHLVWLRQVPTQSKPINFQRLADRLQFLEALGLTDALSQAVPPHRLRQLARQGERMTPQHLKELADQGEQLSILTAFALDKMVSLTDQMLNMNNNLVTEMFQKSNQQRDRKWQRDGKQVNRILGLHQKIGTAVIQARQQDKDPYAAIERVLSWAAYVESVDQAGTLVQGDNFDGMEILPKRYPKIRRYSPRLLSALEFRGTEATRSLREAINVLQERNRKQKLGQIPPDAPKDFIKPSWEPYVVGAEGQIDHRYYELCVLTEIRNSLRSGDLTVKHSRSFKEFDEYLIPLPVWEHMLATKTVPLDIELDFDTYIKERREWLTEQLTRVNALMERGKLPGVELKAGKLAFKRDPRDEYAQEAEALSENLYALVPHVHIQEVLAEVDQWTHFSRCFTHARTGEPVEHLAALYAVILAEAINMGWTKMAEASPSLSEQTLLTTADWFLREDTYRPGLVELVNYHHQLPFVHYWGDGTTSASDGQFFQADKRAALAQINKHYGFQPGVMFMTHHSDQHQPYHATVIGPNDHQAPPMMDGLIHHLTDLNIQEHYSDTGGYADLDFAILPMFGVRYAPRIRDLNEKRLFCFDDPAHYPALRP